MEKRPVKWNLRRLGDGEERGAEMFGQAAVNREASGVESRDHTALVGSGDAHEIRRRVIVRVAHHEDGVLAFDDAAVAGLDLGGDLPGSAAGETVGSLLELAGGALEGVQRVLLLHIARRHVAVKKAAEQGSASELGREQIRFVETGDRLQLCVGVLDHAVFEAEGQDDDPSSSESSHHVGEQNLVSVGPHLVVKIEERQWRDRAATGTRVGS